MKRTYFNFCVNLKLKKMHCFSWQTFYNEYLISTQWVKQCALCRVFFNVKYSTLHLSLSAVPFRVQKKVLISSVCVIPSVWSSVVALTLLDLQDRARFLTFSYNRHWPDQHSGCASDQLESVLITVFNDRIQPFYRSKRHLNWFSKLILTFINFVENEWKWPILDIYHFVPCFHNTAQSSINAMISRCFCLLPGFG